MKAASFPPPPFYGIVHSNDIVPIAPTCDLPPTIPNYTTMVYMDLNDDLHNKGDPIGANILKGNSLKSNTGKRIYTNYGDGFG